MKNLIPRLIQEKFQQKEQHDYLKAVTMFMDISGFTSITEKLMTKGKEGAERLSLLLNTVFNPIIDAIYEKGGIITSFEGDALTILFPVDNTGYAPDTDPESKFKALYSA